MALTATCTYQSPSAQSTPTQVPMAHPMSYVCGLPHTGNDTNYDLALLRWGLITVLDIASTYAYDDPYIPAWTDTLNR